MAKASYIKKGEGWLSAMPPPEEKERLARIRHYQILDSTPEENFDRITQLAATWFNVPYALVSLIDENRQWFKSCIGVDTRETDRDVAFCSHALWQDEVLVIPDATQDDRFRGNPLVTGKMHIRFYAGAPLKSFDGLKLGTLCVIDQKPREFTEKDRNVLAALAALVIDEMDLRLARLKAEEEAEKKSQYVTYMSHEVRTPLTTIQTALSLTRDKPHDEETKNYLRLISQATEILMETINDFLDLAKLETNAVELERIAFKPADIIDQVAGLMRLRTKPGVTLEVETASLANAALLGDPTRLRQIVMNFTGNAVKFTESGTVRIASYLTPDSKGGARLRIEVTDSGIGISADALPKLFCKFQQAEKSTARTHGGSGLGLNISKNLAELMGGCVGASSKTDKGSTFWFEAVFPVAKEAVALHPKNTAQHATPCRILLAEDNVTNQALIGALLKKEGHEVVPAMNGKEACDKACSTTFDIIFMDCQMPEMDGFDATRCIRTGCNNNTPIVALTANAVAGEKDKCLAAGMNDFLTKPVTIEALQSVIGQWSKAKKQA